MVDAEWLDPREDNMNVKGIYNELHPGITMHKIPVKAGFPGLLFTVGVLTVFLIGIPALIYFVVFATVRGIGFAVMLRHNSADAMAKEQETVVHREERK